MNFCPHCGKPVERRVPSGDHLPRDVCDHCGRIHYCNPKVVAGCVPVWGERVMMCRRAIEPRRGCWTFPAGFLELGETSAEGAARETREECGVEVEIDDLMAVLDVPQVGQIYMIHRGRLKSGAHHPTPESAETALMLESEIPWREIAFPTIYHSLKFFFSDRTAGRAAFHSMNLRKADLPRNS